MNITKISHEIRSFTTLPHPSIAPIQILLEKGPGFLVMEIIWLVTLFSYVSK